MRALPFRHADRQHCHVSLLKVAIPSKGAGLETDQPMTTEVTDALALGLASDDAAVGAFGGTNLHGAPPSATTAWLLALSSIAAAVFVAVMLTRSVRDEMTLPLVRPRGRGRGK